MSTVMEQLMSPKKKEVSFGTAGRRGRHQNGLTLIELMVAMTISLFMLIAVAVVYTSSKSGFAYTNNTTRLSEDAAFALDVMGRDIRMAGFAGCTGSNFTTDSAVPPNTIYTPKFDLIANQTPTGLYKPNPFAGVITGNLNNVFTSKNAVWGFAENNSSAISVLGGSISTYSVSTTSPILYLAGGSSESMQISAAVTAVTSDLTIPSDPYRWANNTTNATYFIISDCSGSEIFRASTITSGAGTTKIVAHAATDNASDSFANTYKTDAIISPLVTSVYFLATPKGRGISSLYRRHFNGSVAVVEELVQNVDAITFQYGVNTSNTGGGEPTYIADSYQSDPNTVTDWSRVVSVRMGLVMASEQDSQSAVGGQSVEWLGGTLTPTNDRRLRRAYSTTVSIRNRMGL